MKWLILWQTSCNKRNEIFVENQFSAVLASDGLGSSQYSGFNGPEIPYETHCIDEVTFAFTLSSNTGR